MPNNFDLSNLALKAVCPNNEILYDDKGMPSVMVKIPKMTYAQLGLGTSTATHPAFIVNGQEVDALYISKFQNIVQNGRAYSLPGQDPKTSINFDQALAACSAKGAGWHLMTKMEWAMIAQWCLNNATLPYGNNNYGKDSRETGYQAIPLTWDADGKICHVATGTGPLTWSHDRTPSGIWDLNGNVWEWTGGMRTVYGELQVLANNNAADSDNPQTAASTLWKAINGTTGELMTPSGDGRTTGSLRLSWTGSVWTWTTEAPAEDTDGHGCTLESVTVGNDVGADAIVLLQTLGLYKYSTTAGAYEGDYLYANVTQAERSFFCGGHWYYGASAGVFYSYGYYGRANALTNIGFRSAFVELPAE